MTDGAMTPHHGVPSMPLTLGAYAAQPALSHDDGSERPWYRALADVAGAGGIETFYRGSVHERGPEHLAELLPEGWHVVITALPQAVTKITTSPHYGLASRDPDGRREAVADVRHLLSEAARIDRFLGRRAVRAIELHSSPRRAGAASADARSLARSLRELSAEAEEIPLVIEHCDALVAGQPPAKGFLSLEEEGEAVAIAREEGAVIGQSLNWGRSALEGRSAATAVEHIRTLASAGTLAGVMFSGAPYQRGPLGDAWEDVHNPLQQDDASSLLDEEQVRAALTAIGGGEGLLFLGAKVQDPRMSPDIAGRLAPLSRLAAAIRTGLVSTNTESERGSR